MLRDRVGKGYLDRLKVRLCNGGRYNIRLTTGTYRATFFLRTEVDPPHFISMDKYIGWEQVMAIQDADREGAAWNSPDNYDRFRMHPDTQNTGGRNPCGEQVL